MTAAVVGDVAYGQLPRAARSERHERAAAWIESLVAATSYVREGEALLAATA